MVNKPVDGKSAGPLVVAVLAELDAVGFAVSRAGAGYVVSSRSGDDLAFQPFLSVSEELLREYLEAATGGRSDDRETLSLMKLNLVEELTTDHLDGVNYVRALGYRRSKRGDVEFFVDQEIPEVGRPEPSVDLEWRAE